jgi:hypothetical protein
MKKLAMLLILLHSAATCGTLYQAWSVPFLTAYIDNVATTGASAPDLPLVDNVVIVSMTTIDYRVYGFSVMAGILMDDGSIMDIYRPNIPLSKTAGAPVIIRVSTGSRVPVKVLTLTITRLILDTPYTLVKPTLN